jgi:3-hydroxyisobutyrate dehydrogenase-like beta-hydroxyacid dehydrogenase
MDQKRVGVIGTGRMGNAFVWNLIKAGHKVYVYDINPKAVENLVGQGAILSPPPEMASQVEFIITSLPKNEIVEGTIIGPKGLLPGLNQGSIVIDMSTTLPNTTRAIAEELAKKRSDFLDAPVSGHMVGAKNATLTIMVGGRKEAFLRAKEPIFEKLG